METRPLAPHLELGRTGEELAANWLRSQGYQILERNWKSKYGYELDIIAFKDNCLHVIEVKTRSQRSADFRDPGKAIDRHRVARMRRGIYLYKKYRNYQYDSLLHAITIIFRAENDYDLRFYPNIHLNYIKRKFYGGRPLGIPRY